MQPTPVEVSDELSIELLDAIQVQGTVKKGKACDGPLCLLSKFQFSKD